jgi:hypothetical protein
MNFVDVFDQLRNVASVARKCPTPLLQAAYVTAVREWCGQTRWLRETVPGFTTAGDAIYSLGADPLLEIIAIQAMSLAYTVQPSGTPQTRPVVPSDSGGWDPNRQSSMPIWYSYVPEAQFALFPTPDKQYDLTITVVVQPVDNVARIPEAPLRKYSTIFESGALAQLLSNQGTTWYNPAEAARHGRIFQAGVSNGKAEVQRNFNSGAQRARPRPFLL